MENMEKLTRLKKLLDKNYLTYQEFKLLFNEIYKDLTEEVTLKKKKGKGCLKLQDFPKIIIAKKPQNIDGIVKWTTFKIDKSELIRLLALINMALENRDKITSTRIAEIFYNTKWDNIFTNRKQHNLYTIMLNVLELQGHIKYYRSGKITKESI